MDARARTVRDILRAGDQYLVPFSSDIIPGSSPTGNGFGMTF